MTDKERLKKALDAMIFLPHLKDRQSQSVLSALMPGDSKGGSGRPWDRSDLFRRLKTFKASTWFAKPETIGAVQCARRGWENTAADVLTCECCRAVVSCPIPSQLLPDEARAAADRFSKQLTDAHAVSCPWRSTACSASLLQFPELPKSAVTADFQERSAGLRRLLCLPPLSPEAADALLEGNDGGNFGAAVAQLLQTGPVGPQQQSGGAAAASPSSALKRSAPTAAALRESLVGGGVATCDRPAFAARLQALALCGWALETLLTPGKGSDQAQAAANSATAARIGPESCLLSCGLCGSKAGLWAMFPDCKPCALPGAAAKAAAAAAGGPFGQLRSGGTGSGGGGSNSKPAATVSRHVTVDMVNTIAGGSMAKDAPAGGGPFGANSTAGGCGLFGLPPPSEPAPAASPASTGVNVPVFGFEALRASEPGQEGSQAGGAASKRRHDDAFWDAAVAGEGDKRAKAASIAAASAAAPSQATLQRYRSMSSESVNPLTLHRSFCPWVNCVPGSEGAAACGWQWCVQQLAPADEGRGRRASPASAAAVRRGLGDDESGGEEGRPAPAPWNPSQMLRTALAKVQVKKT